MPTIVFYHNDIDGVISAAAYIAAGYEYNKLKPVTSSDRINFDDIVSGYWFQGYHDVSILDYMNHEFANFWCDHHYDDKYKDDKVYSENIIYDNTAKSAASLMIKRLIDRGYKNDNLIEVLEMVDMIDSAGYPNAKFVFESNHPMMNLKRLIDKTHGAFLTKLVTDIVRYDFDIQKVLDNNMDGQGCPIESEKECVELSEKYMTLYGNVCVLASAGENGWIPKYSEYYLFPDIKYSLRFFKKKGGPVKISIARNPWVEGAHYDVGKLMRENEYVTRGGGHPGAAGGFVDVKDLCDFKIQIVAILNGDCNGKICG